MTTLLIEFLVGLFMAGPALAVILDALTQPVAPGSARSMPRAAIFAFLVGAVLIALAYFKISLIG